MKAKVMHRVFILDDNILSLRLHTDLLVLLGCEVRSCSDSLAAYDLVKEFQPDMAFLDIKMPNESGLSVAGRIRPVMGDRPIYALTALAPDAIRGELIKAGFNDILRKPCSIAKFKQLLRYPA